jgi:hypothetical protein
LALKYVPEGERSQCDVPRRWGAIGATIGRASNIRIPNGTAFTGAVIAAKSAPRKHAGTRKTPAVGDASRRSDIGVITGLGLRTVRMTTDGVP